MEKRQAASSDEPSSPSKKIRHDNDGRAAQAGSDGEKIKQRIFTAEALSVENKSMETLTQEMEKRAKANEPLTEEELDHIVHSLEFLTPRDDDDEKKSRDNTQFRQALKELAHISHKDWSVTEANAQKLLHFLIPDHDQGFPGPLSTIRFNRILKEGNWDGAVQASSASSPVTPWAVLVTGVNGIRKTTSLYQPWFGSLLNEALVPPSGHENQPETPTDNLPTGENSFFRQLDHMIATLCCKDFAILYALTGHKLDQSSQTDGSDGSKAEQQPKPEVIEAYSNLKAALFTRFRTLSELLGVLLLQQAQKVPINCLMETSGRDVAMFRYVDHVFPNKYNKLALHFVVNDLRHAQTSVDQRMVQEIREGIKAIRPDDSQIINAQKVVEANAGGPYGSQVLPGVQEASDRVWDTVVKGTAEGGVGADWFKATIKVNAHEDPSLWTAQAVQPDGSLGTVYSFEKRR